MYRCQLLAVGLVACDVRVPSVISGPSLSASRDLPPPCMCPPRWTARCCKDTRAEHATANHDMRETEIDASLVTIAVWIVAQMIMRTERFVCRTGRRTEAHIVFCYRKCERLRDLRVNERMHQLHPLCLPSLYAARTDTVRIRSICRPFEFAPSQATTSRLSTLQVLPDVLFPKNTAGS